MDDFARCVRYVKKEGDVIKLIPLEEKAENKSNKTVVYCTQVVASDKEELMSGEDIEECLGTVRKAAIFVDRCRKYGTI